MRGALSQVLFLIVLVKTLARVGSKGMNAKEMEKVLRQANGKLAQFDDPHRPIGYRYGPSSLFINGLDVITTLMFRTVPDHEPNLRFFTESFSWSNGYLFKEEAFKHYIDTLKAVSSYMTVTYDKLCLSRLITVGEEKSSVFYVSWSNENVTEKCVISVGEGFTEFKWNFKSVENQKAIRPYLEKLKVCQKQVCAI